MFKGRERGDECWCGWGRGGMVMGSREARQVCDRISHGQAERGPKEAQGGLSPCLGICRILERGESPRVISLSVIPVAMCPLIGPGLPALPASSRLKRAAFPSHPKAPPKSRPMWLDVALLVNVVLVLWLSRVDGVLCSV